MCFLFLLTTVARLSANRARKWYRYSTEELAVDFKQRKAVKLANAEERRAVNTEALTTVRMPVQKAREAARDRRPQGDARRHRGRTCLLGGEDAVLSEEEDEVPVGRTVTVLVNPSEEPVDLTQPGTKGRYTFRKVKQWHWTVAYTDTVAHVKKVLMATFKPIEKLGSKNIKDADRMGKIIPHPGLAACPLLPKDAPTAARLCAGPELVRWMQPPLPPTAGRVRWVAVQPVGVPAAAQLLAMPPLAGPAGLTVDNLITPFASPGVRLEAPREGAEPPDGYPVR
ncbi:hypothetical protein CYMTET_4413 [Cymbomonas tetramitiformis]|uniref:Uncharacterized protein n=1 Tax=Cymbomonas tetramitiformis TaxID=36881 RepID=A0AAE0LK27_9CHLO|nr:hypothetical protein CYMTET_4413 [Cymbomonas tetramitiformis]